MNGIFFILNACLLGVGLAMDAFSVSLANGLNEPKMKINRMISIACIFGLFQTLMPLGGWFCVHKLLETFKVIEPCIPYVALGLLLYIGGKMLIEGVKNSDVDEKPALSLSELMVQGVATSIDALSVGFTIAEYSFADALVETIIIGVVTYVICFVGLILGKKVGTKLSNKASILGGIILIIIGIEIFIEGVIL